MVVLSCLAAVVQIHVFAGLRKRGSGVMPSLCQSRFPRLWETYCAVEGPRWRGVGASGSRSLLLFCVGALSCVGRGAEREGPVGRERSAARMLNKDLVDRGEIW